MVTIEVLGYLKLVRKKLGLSLEMTGKSMGVSINTLTKIEHKRLVGPSTAQKATRWIRKRAKALGWVEGDRYFKVPGGVEEFLPDFPEMEE
jgi:transcriptional regulator with XRE-family HTH domain